MCADAGTPATIYSPHNAAPGHAYTYCVNAFTGYYHKNVHGYKYNHKTTGANNENKYKYACSHSSYTSHRYRDTRANSCC